MSDIRHQLNENPERLCDRLVDNELSPAEQRELLAALEDEPGGWRRCALAFVEANVWRDSLHGVRAEQAVPLLSTASLPNAVPSSGAGNGFGPTDWPWPRACW